MALTYDQIQAQIELANTALTEALTNAKPNYSMGGRSVSRADYIKTLQETISNLTQMQADNPSESVPTAIDNEITVTGSDNTQYEGDNDD